MFPLIPSLRTVARPSLTKDSAMFSPVVSEMREKQQRYKKIIVQLSARATNIHRNSRQLTKTNKIYDFTQPRTFPQVHHAVFSA